MSKHFAYLIQHKQCVIGFGTVLSWNLATEWFRASKWDVIGEAFIPVIPRNDHVVVHDYVWFLEALIENAYQYRVLGGAEVQRATPEYSLGLPPLTELWYDADKIFVAPERKILDMEKVCGHSATCEAVQLVELQQGVGEQLLSCSTRRDLLASGRDS